MSSLRLEDLGDQCSSRTFQFLRVTHAELAIPTKMNVFSFIGLTSLFGRSGVFVFLRDENLKVRRALRSRIHRSVSKHKCRPRRDDCLCLVQERSWQPALLRRQKNVLTRFALACGCDFRPLQMSVRIRSLERAEDQVV